MKPIYLDYNATTPIAKEVADAMLPYLFDNFGNPSSSHVFGVQTKMAVELARKQVANLINARPEEIIFSSGGTEANNYAITGYCLRNQHKGKHIITSVVEHPAVIEVCKNLEQAGFELTVLAVDNTGMVNVNEFKSAIRNDTILVSIMHANNEVGTIQPIEEITAIAKDHEIALHSDAAQSTGKIPVNVNELGVDLLSIAGHKLYAPKGVGALFIREGIELSNLMHGAGHERGRRPGTENVLEIVGLGQACEIAKRDLYQNQKRMQNLRDFFHAEIISAFGAENVRLNGHPEKRLPNTLNISIKGVEAHSLLTRVNDLVAISAGSACHADQVSISGVLLEMEVPDEWARGALRISVGRETTKEEILQAITIIREAFRPE